MNVPPAAKDGLSVAVNVATERQSDTIRCMIKPNVLENAQSKDSDKPWYPPSLVCALNG